MKGKSALQVLLCIDLEPDQLYPVPGQEETWEGSRAAFAWAKRWRAAGPGGHITWFRQMDDSILERHGANGPEVLFRDELAACRAAGDAFGVHLHLYRRRQDGTWLNDLQDNAWIVANLRAALRRFEAWNGGPCRHFSVGDNLLTPAIQDASSKPGSGTTTPPPRLRRDRDHDRARRPGMARPHPRRAGHAAQALPAPARQPLPGGAVAAADRAAHGPGTLREPGARDGRALGLDVQQ